MRVERFYAVAQDGPYGEPEPHGLTLFGILDHATQEHDARTRAGETVRVYRVEPVPDSALYDWGVATNRHPQPAEYVNEHAARNSVGRDGRLHRRRCGTTAWEQVTA